MNSTCLICLILIIILSIYLGYLIYQLCVNKMYKYCGSSLTNAEKLKRCITDKIGDFAVLIFCYFGIPKAWVNQIYKHMKDNINLIITNTIINPIFKNENDNKFINEINKEEYDILINKITSNEYKKEDLEIIINEMIRILGSKCIKTALDKLKIKINEYSNDTDNNYLIRKTCEQVSKFIDNNTDKFTEEIMKKINGDSTNKNNDNDNTNNN